MSVGHNAVTARTDMASIRRRRSVWQAQVRRQGYPPLSRTFHLRADARLWARQTEAELDRGGLPVDSRVLRVPRRKNAYKTPHTSRQQSKASRGRRAKPPPASRKAHPFGTAVIAPALSAQRNRQLRGARDCRRTRRQLRQSSRKRHSRSAHRRSFRASTK